MVIDSNGNILTDFELNRMRIKDVRIMVNETKALSEEFNKLIVSIEHTEEYVNLDKNFMNYMNELKSSLPEEKHTLLMKLNDCYTEILMLYKEYFFKCGYIYALNKNQSVT